MSAKPEGDTPRFLAWLYSTPLQQPVLAALCGIEREIGASLRPGVDHHVAHTRLAWWREECVRCAAGNPAHPLTRELRVHLERLAPGNPTHPALAGLSGLVDVATWDLAGTTFERRAELTAYCRRWAAAMVTPVPWGLGTREGTAQGGAGEAAAAEFGVPVCELELLGRLARDARRGRLRVPLDELAQAGVAPEALATLPWTEGLVAILRGRHRALRQQLATAVAALPPQTQQGAMGLLVWAALAWQESVRAERALPHGPDQAGPAPVASIAGVAAANWRAWRTARAAAAGRLRLS